MSSSSLITDPKAICIPVPQIPLCQALQNWSSPLLKFVEFCVCVWDQKLIPELPDMVYQSLAEVAVAEKWPHRGRGSDSVYRWGHTPLQHFPAHLSVTGLGTARFSELDPTDWEGERKNWCTLFLQEKWSHGGPTTWSLSLQKPVVQLASIFQSQESGTRGEGFLPSANSCLHDCPCT